MQTIWKWAIVLNLVMSLGASRVEAQDSPEKVVLAIVNGDSILAEQLEGELMRIHSGQQETSRANFDIEKVLDKLVNDCLLVQDARWMKLDQEPEFRKEVDSYRQTCALEQYLAEAIPDTFPLEEQEIEAYYGENYRRIHFYLLKLRDRQQADSAARFLGSARHLADIAEKFPSEMYRFGSGDQGFKTWRDLDPTLQPEMKELIEGQIAGPFEHANGYSFIEILGEQPADTALLAQHRPRIRALLNQQRKRQFREDLVQSLKSKYSVQIHDSLLQQNLALPDSLLRKSEFQGLEIARVGDSPISIKALNKRRGHGGRKDNPDLRKNLIRESLDGLIEERLFAQEAAALDYAQSSSVSKYVRAFEDSLLLYGYLSETIASQIEVSEAAIDSFYQAKSELFRQADEVRLGQLTVGKADSAEQIVVRLRGGADFIWLVRECSTDEYAVKDGDRGWFSLASLFPAMKAALDTAQLGQYLGPYSGEDGFLIYRLNDRRQGEIPELAKVRGRIEQILFQNEFNRILKVTLAELKEDAVIEIRHEALKKLVIGGTNK